MKSDHNRTYYSGPGITAGELQDLIRETKERFPPLPNFRVVDYLPPEPVFKKPRKKSSRRWQKKYKKKYPNPIAWKPNTSLYQIGNTIYCSRRTWEKMLRAFNRRIKGTMDDLNHSMFGLGIAARGASSAIAGLQTSVSFMEELPEHGRKEPT